jgi:hypothetical protein
MKRPGQHAWALAAAVLLCGLVFLSYLRPSLIVDLGNRVWACF